jgi:predicted O-methyltransferase YrrM
VMSRTRLSRVVLAAAESGPRNVLLARRAKQRGAAQKIRELAALCRFLRKRNPRSVLEIGTLRGATLWTWSTLASPDALLIAVDLNEPSSPLAVRDTQRVEFVKGDSHRPETRERVERILDGRRLDLLFIDGDHTYDGVRQDFEMYAPLVGEGGSVVFHDILRHSDPEDSEVHRFWEELESRYETRELVDPGDLKRGHPWGGLGVLVMPQDHV